MYCKLAEKRGKRNMSTTLECVIDIAANAVTQILKIGERKKKKRSLMSNRPFTEKLQRSVNQGDVALSAGWASKSK